MFESDGPDAYWIKEKRGNWSADFNNSLQTLVETLPSGFVSAAFCKEGSCGTLGLVVAMRVKMTIQ